VGVFSFNGNKVVTTGGGGVVVTNDAALAQRGKHLTTTAKVPHKWEFVHDELGYNFRMPNLNAAVGCAQLEVLDTFITSKRATAQRYQDFCTANGIRFFAEPSECCSNYWLNAIVLDDFEQRERFLAGCAAAGVQARPIWRLMNTLPMYKNCMCDELKKARWFEERVVNIPSSVRV
jgi:dTDP-4-amino-4,6-dideoxygalactose transaminase